MALNQSVFLIRIEFNYNKIKDNEQYMIPVVGYEVLISEGIFLWSVTITTCDALNQQS